MDREDYREIANEVVWGLLRVVVGILLLVGVIWLIFAFAGTVLTLTAYAFASWYMVLVPVVLTIVIIACGRR